MRLNALIPLFCLLPLPALAQAPMSVAVTAAFEDVTFDVENAIVNQGLVVDWVSHVGEMLNRTGEAVDGAEPLYLHADVYNFCSAALSRAVMQADPSNIQHCPYGIFVYEHADALGQIVIGHRVYEGETMAPVNELLDLIVNEAAGQ